MPNPALKTIRWIVFTGPSQSGKSTAAGLLVSTFRSRGHLATRASFEQPMRQYLSLLLGRKSYLDQMDAPVFELLSKSARDFLNREAAHLRFSYGPGVLGRLLATRASRRLAQYVIVDDGTSLLDCRELGGAHIIVAVYRDRVERVYPFTIPNPNITIRNEGTIEQLKFQVAKIADVVEAENAKRRP